MKGEKDEAADRLADLRAMEARVEVAVRKSISTMPAATVGAGSAGELRAELEASRAALEASETQRRASVLELGELIKEEAASRLVVVSLSAELELASRSMEAQRAENERQWASAQAEAERRLLAESALAGELAASRSTVEEQLV